MGTDEGGARRGPRAHRVHLPAFYIDRHEVTNAQFAEFVRRSGSFDTVEGPWFRYSVEGCGDLIAHYEERYGVELDSFDPDTRRRSACARRLPLAVGDRGPASDGGTGSDARGDRQRSSQSRRDSRFAA